MSKSPITIYGTIVSIGNANHASSRHEPRVEVHVEDTPAPSAIHLVHISQARSLAAHTYGRVKITIEPID